MPSAPASPQQIGALLADLVARADAPRALAVAEADRDRVREAVERAGAQLLGEVEVSFTIALAGCSGAGKSTLINALAGGAIAETSELRPCTRQIKVYHHRDVASGGLPEELARQALFVAHDRPELRHKVIVDTPDLDTIAVENRAATRALLKAAGLVIYVFSPERYVEERAWSVIREEQRFSHCLAVVNKADLVTPEELAKICEEVRVRFAAMGKPDLRVLALCAARHVPGATPPDAGPPVLDEFLTLRAYIEHELSLSDMAQMLRKQRARVVDHLADEIETLLPPAAEEQLQKLADAAQRETQELTAALQKQLASRLLAVEAELEPLAIVRAHQRYRGPFGAWLSTWDFLRYQLPRLVRQMRILGGSDETTPAEQLLVTGQEEPASDLLRGASRRLQDVCFEGGLPVARWSEISARPSGDELLRRVATSMQAEYEASAAQLFGQSRWFTGGVSLIAFLAPIALLVFALYTLWQELVTVQLSHGFDLLGLVVAMTVLFYALLHGLVDLVHASFENLLHEGTGARVLAETAQRTIADWVTSYRADVEADLAGLRGPVAKLRTLLDRRALHFALPGTWTTSPDESELPTSESPAPPPDKSPAEPSPASGDASPLDAGSRLRRALERHGRPE